MSTTVAEMYNHLKYWIGEEVDALYLVNTAIRFVAERLYILDSELVIDIMTVPLYPAVTLTGSDIAFVDGGASAGTITQVAAGFVTAGFDAGVRITTSSTSNPGPFRVASVTDGTITLYDEDNLNDETAGSSVTITSAADCGFLPPDFWGLGQFDPYLVGKTTPLMPVPDTLTEIQFASSGVPYYYKIRGELIYVIPAASSAQTIKADYFYKPATMENTTDYLPWNDMFNDVIYEIVINLFKKSGILVPELQAILNRVDLIAVKRGKKAPRQLKRGIRYEDYK